MQGDSSASAPDVLSVSALTRRIKQTLEAGVGAVWVEGELSNVRRPSSGHIYFTLKDEQAQIAAVLFRGNQRGLRFTPRDGMQCIALGDVTVYERGGNYQVIVRRLQESGIGALQRRFEELKAKLQAEGLFAAERKRPLPVLPRHVGVVTSATGAAIRDILNVLSRRFPNMHLVLAPAMVQGAGAAEAVAGAIGLLNEQYGPESAGPERLDVLIVGRGGGSLEDLWCFNEEIVARAIAASAIPVIAAVGHEIDFTIADFVADLRAPTPSAAAELVVGRKDAFETQLDSLRDRLTAALKSKRIEWRQRVTAAAGSYVFREPGNLARQFAQRLDTAELRMARAMQGQAADGRQRLADLPARMVHAARRQSDAARQNVLRLDAQLRMLNPLAVLERGYSLTTDAEGRVLRRSAEVRAGQTVSTRLADGKFESVVQ